MKTARTPLILGGAILIIVIAIGAFWYISALLAPPAAAAPETSSSVVLDGQTISVDLAETPADQELGLGGRTSLGSHQGMLFIFPSDAEHFFWMKDMHFSIDMIWLSDDGTVLYIQPDVSPSTYPEAFGPKENSRYVLEVPANFAQMYGIKVGDKATLP